MPIKTTDPSRRQYHDKGTRHEAINKRSLNTYFFYCWNSIWKNKNKKH